MSPCGWHGYQLRSTPPPPGMPRVETTNSLGESHLPLTPTMGRGPCPSVHSPSRKLAWAWRRLWGTRIPNQLRGSCGGVVVSGSGSGVLVGPLRWRRAAGREGGGLRRLGSHSSGVILGGNAELGNPANSSRPKPSFGPLPCLWDCSAPIPSPGGR